MSFSLIELPLETEESDLDRFLQSQLISVLYLQQLLGFCLTTIHVGWAFHSKFLTFLGLGALVFRALKKNSSGFAIPAIAIGALALAVGYKYSRITGSINDSVWRLPAKVLLNSAGVSSLLAVLQWLSLPDPFNTFMATTGVSDLAKWFANKNNHKVHYVKFLLREAANDSSCIYRAKTRFSSALANWLRWYER